MKTEPAATGNTFKSVKEVESAAKARMEKAVTDLQHAMASIRTGRASVSIFDNLKVDYYGTPTPLNQLANLHVPEPTMITIQPWDVSQIGAIDKAIRGSDLGLNPANDVRRSSSGCTTLPRITVWPSATSGVTPTST